MKNLIFDNNFTFYFFQNCKKCNVNLYNFKSIKLLKEIQILKFKGMQKIDQNPYLGVSAESLEPLLYRKKYFDQ